jgi:N-dimethylarginine dimethylaminohydrolase
MCPPEHFDVVYRINPWMNPLVPVDRALASRQWESLVETYRSLGHTVEIVEPLPGLPDMVFAANCGLVLGGRALASRFRHAERRGEEAPYRSWLAARGFETRPACGINEGEGDFAVAGPIVLAGWGYRSTRDAHAEAQEYFGRPVVSLQLVDPRFYHLDTALVVLDDRSVAYYPPAFSPGSRRVVERLFPEVIEAEEADALVLGLNATSDGRHVILASEATGLAFQLRARGFEPVPVDVSEFRKAGGGPKCCTLELRS